MVDEAEVAGLRKFAASSPPFVRITVLQSSFGMKSPWIWKDPE
jgi:hypothetical protein